MESRATPNCLAYFKEKLTVFRRQLNRYIKNPDDDAIHDVRTAFRRLESAYQALPKACKSDASRRYLKQGKQFFSLNSQVRDCDVMIDKFEKLGLDKKSPLLKELRRTRKKELRHAMEEAEKLKALARPRFKQPDDGASLLNMQVHKRAMQFLCNKPLVLAGEDNVDEVHEMRKDAKKLFYLLEQDEHLASLRQMINIKMFQRLAGEIHDADVAIEFLEQRSKEDPAVAGLLEVERTERHAYYQELCGLLRDEDWQTLATLWQGS